MKKIYLFLSAFVLSMALTNCGSDSHNHDHGHSHDEHSREDHSHSAEAEPQMLTAYSSSLEILAEVGEMQVGEESFILAHITTLSDFKPLDVPEVTFTLTVGGKAVKSVARRQSPGIYRCHITPENDGAGFLICNVALKNGVTENLTFSLSVCKQGHHHHAHGEASHEHGSNMVAFPKEQSWKIDFATEIVEPRAISRVVKGVAKVSNAPENVTTIVAATSGKVHYGNTLAVGRSVRAGEPLFVMETGDVADNNAAIKFADAESRYNYAKAEYERKAVLVKTKIVTLTDYQSAEAAYLQAKAVYENLKKNFKDGKMLLKAPSAGYLSDIAVSSGDYVAEGMPLATLQRDGEKQLFCEVSVRHAEALRDVTDVNIELNDGRCFSLAEAQGRIVGIGRGIQNDCNMIPVTVMAKNLPGVVPGNVVNMYLISPTTGESIVVPRTALVEEMGRFFVFVQHTPVMFEKRQVSTGVTDGKNVQLLSGVKSGERVVTNGAVSLKLSQGAGALDPHAGHVH